MRFIRNASFLILASAMTWSIAGCKPSETASNAPAENSPNKTFSTEANPDATNKAADANNPLNEDLSKASTIGVEALPAELKNDAYEYYGLGRTDTIKLQAKTPQGTQEGSQVVALKKIVGNKALFLLTASGAVAGYTGTFSLEAGGIKIVKSDKVKVSPDEWEFPSDLKPGKTWTNTNEVTEGAATMKLTTTNKVVGIEKVQTPVATYPDALLVTSVGTGTRSGVEIRIETKNWFVKGRGMVKSEFSAVPKGGAKESYTLEEAK